MTMINKSLYGLCAIVWLMPGLAGAQIESSLPPPVVTAYEPEECVKREDVLKLVGANFSDLRGNRRVMFWSAGREVEVTVLTWHDSEIRVRVPGDARIQPGQRYEVRIEGPRGQFRGTGGRMILICKDAAEAKPTRAPTADATQNEIIAKRLVAGVMKASGVDHWTKVKRVQFTFNVEDGKKRLVEARHDWNVRAGTDTVSWDDKNVTVSLAQPGKKPEEQAAYQRWVNDSYWLIAPLKLADPGVKATYRGRHSVGSKTYEVLNVQFERVGLTPTDQYNLYIDSKTYLVRRWDYIPANGNKLSGTWDKYQDFGGLKLATEHEFGGKRIWMSDVKVEK